MDLFHNLHFLPNKRKLAVTFKIFPNVLLYLLELFIFFLRYVNNVLQQVELVVP